mmetsp:Transcript_7929/g.23393  ORF Transcript_7929/g.23393 Transcript_7929/m.23393 type:complete len:365 (-) Transcript_7929:3978-5072(-)
MAVTASHVDSVSATHSKDNSTSDLSSGFETKSVADIEYLDGDDSLINIEPLNDMIDSAQSSNNTLNSNSQTTCSFGESSLSSFLSVLFEDEENIEREISIVSDNAKPEKQSVRDLYQTFRQSALEHEKPKSRWDYITLDSSDHLVSLSRRRNKLQVRSSSFSGRMSSTKRGVRMSNSFSSGQKNSTKSMFLRMPERKQSPTTNAEARKRAIAERFKRVNMSDSGLMHLPLPSRNSSGREGPRLTRAGEHEANTGNASWSSNDMRDRRKPKSNRFLDILLETDDRKVTSAPKPARRRTSQNEADENMSSSIAALVASLDENGDTKPGSTSPPRKPSRNTKSPKTPIRRMKSPPPDHNRIAMPDLG